MTAEWLRDVIWMPALISLFTGLWIAVLASRLDQMRPAARWMGLAIFLCSLVVFALKMTVGAEHFVSGPIIFSEMSSDLRSFLVTVVDSGGTPGGRSQQVLVTPHPGFPLDLKALSTMEYKNERNPTMDVWGVSYTATGRSPELVTIPRSTWTFSTPGVPYSLSRPVIRVQYGVGLNCVLPFTHRGADSLLLLGYDGRVLTAAQPRRPLGRSSDASRFLSAVRRFDLRELAPTPSTVAGWQSFAWVPPRCDTLVAVNCLSKQTLLIALDDFAPRVLRDRKARSEILGETATYDATSAWLEGKSPFSSRSGYALDGGTQLITRYDSSGTTTFENVGSLERYPEGIAASHNFLFVSGRDGRLLRLTLRGEDHLENWVAYDGLKGRIQHGQGISIADRGDGLWFAAEDHVRFVSMDAFGWKAHWQRRIDVAAQVCVGLLVLWVPFCDDVVRWLSGIARIFGTGRS